MLCVDSNGNNKESLLTIVTNQRERFKQRNIELESVCTRYVLYCRMFTYTIIMNLCNYVYS